MKRVVCALAAVWLFCTASGVSSARTPGEMRRVPVLMYHSVCKTNVGEFVISPDTLRSDFAYLKEKGYTAVFMQDIIDFCDGKADLPEKPIVLTFDDGFYNNIFYAEKIAREYDMKMVVSVVGAYVDKERDEKKRSPVYSYVNESELAAFYKRGRAEIGNHSYDLHRTGADGKGIRCRKGESAEAYARRLTADSEKCRRLIEKACGCTVNVFAYPFGCYSKATPDILRKLGYRAVLTCKGGVNTFYKGRTDGLFSVMRYNRRGNMSTQRFFAKLPV